MDTKKTLFLIDDCDLIRLYVANLVEETGCVNSLVTFGHGFDAMKFLEDMANCESALPDVILLDLDMPGMNAWDFLEIFEKMKCQLNKNITVYVHSYASSPAEILMAKTFKSVIGITSKPVSRHSLQSMMGKNIN